MSNPFAVSCNEQLALSRYHLCLLQSSGISVVGRKAQLQALCFSLHLSLKAYISELGYNLARQPEALGSIDELQELAQGSGVVTADITELSNLQADAGSWLSTINYLQQECLTLKRDSAKAEAVDASLIASTRREAPRLDVKTLSGLLNDINELVFRQRSNNVEC